MDHKFKAILSHMLGMYSDTPGYRNYFCASEKHRDYPTLLKMQEQGLIEWQEWATVPEGGLWLATEKGKKLVGAPLT